MRIGSFVFVFLAALSLGTIGFSDSPAGQAAGSQPKKSATTAKITLYPAAAPTPSLKYQFRPPFLEDRSGNAAVHYLMINTMEHQRLVDSEFQDFVTRLLAMPLDELRHARDENLRADVKTEKRWATSTKIRSIGFFARLIAATNARYATLEYQSGIPSGSRFASCRVSSWQRRAVSCACEQDWKSPTVTLTEPCALCVVSSSSARNSAAIAPVSFSRPSAASLWIRRCGRSRRSFSSPTPRISIGRWFRCRARASI